MAMPLSEQGSFCLSKILLNVSSANFLRMPHTLMTTQAYKSHFFKKKKVNCFMYADQMPDTFKSAK